MNQDDMTWAEWVMADRGRKFDLVRKMESYLGGFMYALAQALAVADSTNAFRILTTWQDVLEAHYPMMAEAA